KPDLIQTKIRVFCSFLIVESIIFTFFVVLWILYPNKIFPSNYLKNNEQHRRWKKNEQHLTLKLKFHFDLVVKFVDSLKQNIKLHQSPERKIDNERQRSNLGKISFDSFKNLIKLSNIFNYHKELVNSIDYSTFDNSQIICSGSNDCTINVFNFDIKKEINKIILSKHVECAKFSKYHYHNNKKNIEFSSFNDDNNVRLCDVGESKLLNIFTEHTHNVNFVAISPSQSNNGNKNDNTGIIGGNGYTKINKQEHCINTSRNEDNDQQIMIVCLYVMAHIMAEFVFGSESCFIYF
ncbi:hypothetical protein RFI_02868, partial [Reticulomyxa filosa]